MNPGPPMTLGNMRELGVQRLIWQPQHQLETFWSRWCCWWYAVSGRAF